MNLLMDDNTPIDVIRTNRRKTASIKVINGRVQVIVPENLSEIRIQQIVHNRKPWIREKLNLQSEQSIPKPKEYISGESFSYLGKNYRLKVLLNEPTEVKLKGGNLVVGVYSKWSDTDRNTFMRKELVKWFEHHALVRLTEKTNRFAKMLGVSPRSISVRDFTSRWGSCCSSGNITYNWRIVIAPHSIVDYVVVHELCHLLEHNHSDEFWRNVSKVLPDYQSNKDWLKFNGLKLVI